MKKVNHPTLLIALLIVLGALSCKKSPKVTYMSFAGETKSWYEHLSIDPITHLPDDRHWDSTYNEVVDVMIDEKQKIIRFTLRYNGPGVRPPGQVHTYPFDERKIAYVTHLASHSALSFSLSGNFLYMTYSNFSGYSPNSTEVSVKFKGQLAK